MSKHLLKVWSACIFFTLQCAGSASPALAAGIAGTYTGSYSGSDSGIVTITIDSLGNVFCSLTDSEGNTNAWANGTAISYMNGTVNGYPFLQMNMTCATGFGFGYIDPAYNLGMSGTFEAGPSVMPTIEGSWFTSNGFNGNSGMFTAAYSASMSAATTADTDSLSGR